MKTIKTTKTQGILLGIGVLGLGTLLGLGTTPTAQAQTTTVTRTTRIQTVQYRRPAPRRNNRRPRPAQVKQTYTGRVVNDTKGNDFTLRADNGSTFRVLATRGESGKLNRNDRVQVTGTFSNGTLRADRVVILRNR